MKKALIAFGILLAIILILGLVAPKEFKVERSITINKPKEAVFNYIKNLKNNNNWNPWAKKDPNIKMEYRGTDGQVGSVSAWTGNKDVGTGEQEIISITEGQRIDLALRFKEPMEDTSKASFTTESVDSNQTKVTWVMEGQMMFPFNVVCLFMGMDKMIGKDFEEGLTSLKALLEQ